MGEELFLFCPTCQFRYPTDEQNYFFYERGTTLTCGGCYVPLSLGRKTPFGVQIVATVLTPESLKRHVRGEENSPWAAAKKETTMGTAPAQVVTENLKRKMAEQFTVLLVQRGYRRFRAANEEHNNAEFVVWSLDGSELKAPGWELTKAQTIGELDVIHWARDKEKLRNYGIDARANKKHLDEIGG